MTAISDNLTADADEMTGEAVVQAGRNGRSKSSHREPSDASRAGEPSSEMPEGDGRKMLSPEAFVSYAKAVSDRLAEVAKPYGDGADDRKSQPMPALPRAVPGGFAGVASDLDRQGRDRAMMVRLLAQQSLLLEASENEKRRLTAELERIAVVVRDTTRALERGMASTKAGDVTSNLSGLFADNLAALNELENVATALTTNILLVRSSWEPYARSVLNAHKMREDTKA